MPPPPSFSTVNFDTKFTYDPYSFYQNVNHTPCFTNISPIHLEKCDFHDDEPLPDSSSTLPTGNGKLAVKTFTEFPAITASDSKSEFVALLNVRGPPLSLGGGQSRVPVDLVFVLDVSRSMEGAKFSLLKSATRFVIDHMMPCDRLSIVTFSRSARRIFPLRRMTQGGRQHAKFAVDQVHTEISTNIRIGLNMGAKVLEERRVCNPVSSIILVSDGQDNAHHSGHASSYGSSSKAPEYLKWLVPSIVCGNRDTFREYKYHGQGFPVHAFGVGMDHDSVALNAISDASGGTFSFLESAEIIPTSFAISDASGALVVFSVLWHKMYEQAGRPLLLTGLGAHKSQRAKTLSHTYRASMAEGYGPTFGAPMAAGAYGGAAFACGAAPSAYDTPMMQMMVSKTEDKWKGEGVNPPPSPPRPF